MADKPNCEFASWLDGYFLCKSHGVCEFQEGAGLTFYCGRSDALKLKGNARILVVT